MKYDPAKHKRRSIRLQKYDYSAPGAYFITICTHQRQCLFGEILAGQMELNATGLWVQACWRRSPYRFSQLTLDAFVIMPNHLHGILWLGDENRMGNDTPRRGEAFGQKTGDTPCKGEAFGQKTMEQPEIFWPNASPLPKRYVSPITPNGTKSGSVAAIIQNFKSISTRRINQIQNNAGRTLWQRNYYEHIIRDNTALQNIQNYIRNNPLSWQQDQLHPDHPANIEPPLNHKRDRSVNRVKTDQKMIAFKRLDS
jgi:putative transposase